MSKNKSMARSILPAVFLLVLAAAGGYFGVRFAQRQPAAPAATEAPPERSVPAFLQASVAQFPQVQLVGTQDKVPVSSLKVLPEHGGVVLFLDMNCDPCKYVAGQWQDHIREGRVKPEQVVGITPNPVDQIEPFRGVLDLWFTIYSDPLQKFVDEQGVDTFPWEVIVDADGTVVGYSGDLTQMGRVKSLEILGPG